MNFAHVDQIWRMCSKGEIEAALARILPKEIGGIILAYAERGDEEKVSDWIRTLDQANANGYECQLHMRQGCRYCVPGGLWRIACGLVDPVLFRRNINGTYEWAYDCGDKRKLAAIWPSLDLLIFRTKMTSPVKLRDIDLMVARELEKW